MMIIFTSSRIGGEERKGRKTAGGVKNDSAAAGEGIKWGGNGRFPNQTELEWGIRQRYSSPFSSPMFLCAMTQIGVYYHVFMGAQ